MFIAAPLLYFALPVSHVYLSLLIHERDAFDDASISLSKSLSYLSSRLRLLFMSGLESWDMWEDLIWFSGLNCFGIKLSK